MKNINYGKIKFKHLIFIWVVLFSIIVLNILLYWLNDNEFFNTVILFISIIILLFTLIVEKPLIEDLDMKHRYQKLLQTSKGVTPVLPLFEQSLVPKLLSDGFTQQISNELFTIFYKITPSITRKSMIKTGVLILVTIIHKNSLDLYSELIEKEHKKIWNSYEKINRLNKQLSIQFKRFSELTEDIKNDLNRIICYKQGDNYLVNINCGYIESKKALYFLHSDSFSPNYYYQLGVEQIKSLIN